MSERERERERESARASEMKTERESARADERMLTHALEFVSPWHLLPRIWDRALFVSHFSSILTPRSRFRHSHSISIRPPTKTIPSVGHPANCADGAGCVNACCAQRSDRAARNNTRAHIKLPCFAVAALEAFRPLPSDTVLRFCVGRSCSCVSNTMKSKNGGPAMLGTHLPGLQTRLGQPRRQ